MTTCPSRLTSPSWWPASGPWAGAPPRRCPPSLEHGDLSLDPARRVAVRAGRRLPLTTKELAVLECLLAADGRPVPAEELLERVWDEAADPFTSTVKTTIGRLRAKLGDPPVIQTVRESGYRIGGTLMRTPARGRPRWLRLPRRTARLRLTVLYGGAVFLACGATVLAVTYLLYGQLGERDAASAPSASTSTGKAK